MNWLTSFLRKHSENAVVAALIASIFALAASFGSVYLTYSYGNVTQEKQVKLEALARFDQTSQKIVEVGGEFISAVNESQDLSPSKERIRSFAASQVTEAEALRKFFPGNKSVENYQDALTVFMKTADKTKDVTEMRPWVESFGRVIDTKTKLAKDLYHKLGVAI